MFLFCSQIVSATKSYESQRREMGGHGGGRWAIDFSRYRYTWLEAALINFVWVSPISHTHRDKEKGRRMYRGKYF